MRGYWFGVVAQSPRGGSPAQHHWFNRAIECTRALFDFSLYTWYKSQDDATLSDVWDAWSRDHTIKDGFLHGQAGIWSKARGNPLRSELVMTRKVDEQTIACFWTMSMKPLEMNTWLEYLSQVINMSKELDADFNFPKIRWRKHWAEQICR